MANIYGVVSPRDLWEVVGGNKTMLPPANEAEALQKWKIKAGNAMLAIKTKVKDKMLKEAWNTFISLFSKNNDARLQLLENEQLSLRQEDMTIK